MGVHFDGLVELVNGELSERERNEILGNPKQHFTHLLNEAALFELPLNSKDVMAATGKARAEYIACIREHFSESEKAGVAFAMPFPVTAVEDKDSAVILQYGTDSTLLSTVFWSNVIKDSLFTYFIAGDARLREPLDERGIFNFDMGFYYGLIFQNGMRQHFPDIHETNVRDCMTQDLLTATVTAIGEIVYIMDPSNFVIEKENNSSRSIFAKKKGNSKGFVKARKTVMRPHYICLGEEDTNSFLRGESIHPVATQAVRGHYRRLRSPVYVKAQGKKLIIPQYFRGPEEVMARQGWTYRVMLKSNALSLVPYSREDAR